MDGSGLGDISCYTTLQRMSGRIKLLHLSDRLQYLLVITKLTYVFETAIPSRRRLLASPAI